MRTHISRSRAKMHTLIFLSLSYYLSLLFLLFLSFSPPSYILCLTIFLIYLITLSYSRSIFLLMFSPFPLFLSQTSFLFLSILLSICLSFTPSFCFYLSFISHFFVIHTHAHTLCSVRTHTCTHKLCSARAHSSEKLTEPHAHTQTSLFLLLIAFI